MSTPEPGHQVLLNTVVRGGFCSGCGACASVDGSALHMEFTSYGCFVPVLSSNAMTKPVVDDITKVCPFYPNGEDELTLSQKIFGNTCKYHEHVGNYLACYAGHVIEGNFRNAGSSGGLTTWILTELLHNKRIDGVIHVVPDEVVGGKGPLFKFALSTTEEQIQSGSKSKYHPVEMSQVINLARKRPGKYVFVGVPCFVKAVRQLQKVDDRIAEAIPFCVSLFCGHMKTRAFAELLAWQVGIHPKELLSFDYRVKKSGRPASRYNVLAIGQSGNTPSSPVSAEAAVSDLYGSDWGEGFFKLQACDFCDDIAGETADITLGDAWLPEYNRDSQGTNIVVVRNKELKEMLELGIESNRIKLDPIEVQRIYDSQAGNYRHRREGLAYRLWLLDQKGDWHPTKRVQAEHCHLTETRKRIYEQRSAIARLSHEAFLEAKSLDDLRFFMREMEPVLKRYRKTIHPLWWRLARSVKRHVLRGCNR